jgi:hypothetical protein
MPAKKDVLTLYGQLLREGLQLEQDEQVSLENHVLIVQLAILQAKHSALKKPAQARI